MKKLTRSHWIILILSFAPLLVTAIFYPRLPAKIPMHWDFSGVVSYSDKYQLWIVAAISVFLGPLLLLMPRLDPKRRNILKFQNSYDSFAIVMVLFMLGMVGMIISESLYPGHLSVSTTVTAFVGLLFAFLGNMFPKVKKNFTLGIRTPWTLSSEEVWNRTHRLAGKLWFVSGLLLMVAAFLLKGALLYGVLFTVIIIVALIPYVMSYVWYRQLGGNSDDSAEDGKSTGQ